MRASLQFVCQTGLVALVSGSLLGASLALAAKPSEPVVITIPGQTEAGQSKAAALEAEVMRWIAGQADAPVGSVRMVPLDPRLQLNACNTPFKFDAPFTNLETVRVRCEQPQWQLYVRLDFKNKSKGPPMAGAAELPRVLAPKRTVLVAGASLPRGTSLGADLVSVAEIDAALAGPQALERVADIENMELARPVAAGAPIRSFDLRPTLLVKKGQNVKMQLGQGRGFNITAQLEALQDGRMGEQIRLKNPESGRLVSGVVVGQSAVRGL